MSNHFDLVSQHVAVKGLTAVVSTNNDALVSDTIDLQGTDGVMAILTLGTLSDASGATFDFQLFHGDASNMSDEGSAISDTDLLYGTAAQLTEVTGDGAVQQLGYRGAKRYLRAKLIVAGNSGNVPAAIVFVKRVKKVGSL